MKIAVVGVGYWGPNLVRNFLKNPEVTEVICYDVDASRYDRLRGEFPSVRFSPNLDGLMTDRTVAAVALATPVATHFPLAEQALRNGKHVFLEKPMTASVKDAEALIDLAAANDRRLMVDHIFVYHPAVRKIKDLIASGEIGNVLYFDGVRINLGLFQHDVNVLWDLAIHDLSILDFLVDEKPRRVSAVGMSHYGKHEDIAYLSLFYDNNCLAHLHVNWLAPVKMRRIVIGGTKKMIVFDDVEPVEKIRVYDKGVEVTSQDGLYDALIQYRTGDMYAPRFETSEALLAATNDFVTAIKHGRFPLADGGAGLRMVRILAAAERSMKNHGFNEEI